MKKVIITILIATMFCLVPKQNAYAGMQPLTPKNVKKVTTTKATRSEFCKLKISDTDVADFSKNSLVGLGSPGQDEYISTLDKMECTEESKEIIYGTLAITRNIPTEDIIYEQVFVIDDNYLRPTNLYNAFYVLDPEPPKELDTHSSIKGIFKGLSVAKGSLKYISDVVNENFAGSDYYTGDREFAYLVHVNKEGIINNIYVLYKGEIYKYQKSLKEIEDVLLVDYTNGTSPTLTPDSDPTVNWKTYIGNGFSFQYSPQWSYTEQNSLLIFSRKIREPQPTGSFEGPPEYATVEFSITPKAENVTIDNWVQNELDRENIKDFNPEIKRIQVAGVDAIETAFPSMNGQNVTVFIKNNYVYKLTINFTYLEDKKTQFELKSEILSTFKFADSIITPSIAVPPFIYDAPTGWKKSINSNYNHVLTKTESFDGTIKNATSTITIYAKEVPNTMTLSKWLEERYSRNDQNLFNIAKQSIKDGFVDGTPSKYIEIPGAGGYNDAGTVFIHNNIGYDISLTGLNLSSSISSYQQVLSSFKITKK